MNKHLRLCLALACLLVVSPVVALPLDTQLSFSFDTPLLAQDPQIGQLLEPEKGSVEAYTAEALSEPYSLDWIERYVAKDVRPSFVRSFDQVLSKLLPQTEFSLGKGIHRQESRAVPFRYGEEMKYGTFVWIEVSEGMYTLISITLNP